MERGYECLKSGRTIRAWDKDGVLFVCLVDIFGCLDLEEQKIEEKPKMVEGEFCVTHKCFMNMLDHSKVAQTPGTPANELKRYLWSVPSPHLSLRA